MIASMTGFAAATAELPGCSLGVEMRSVNHRYLDIQLKLPDELRGLDATLRDLFTGQIRRGKVDCRVTLTHTLPGEATLAVNAERVAQLRDAAAEVRRHAPDSAPISVADILRWPGVLTEPSLPPEALAERVMELARRTLAELTASRVREGAKLKTMLEERCHGIEAQVERVAPRIPAIHSAYVEKLGARLKEAGLDPDTERLKQELALFAAKIDVAEELSRLAAHVVEVRRVLAAGGASGKRLDFLMQELNREANTLGSKSVDAELSQAALEMKVLIEQMREQVQNIE
ncbi:MAG TPA: YicC/YloC family endoribonuclease [Casimicrobiaceae bacterium]|nr:YicC/YloC family endoribonuclease [Casimicrobiaceae bacterium]